MSKRLIAIMGNDDGSLANELAADLVQRGIDVTTAWDNERLGAVLQETVADLVVLAPRPAEARRWVEVIQRYRRHDRERPIVLIVREGSEELAVAALRARVDDYFRYPVSAGEIAAGIERCLAGPRMQSNAERPLTGLSGGHVMIGDSSRMREIKRYVGNVAATDSNVLITGETGTGKELVAELIHRNSPRAGRPFVSINCAAIPDNLLESELFGYERGAFTGAHTQKEGSLKLAGGGSAFFDEIGDMSLYAQAKILRAIESREVQRLGGTRTVPLDIRVIAATNQELEHLIEERKFRRDLYFRINVARIQLPPLRERREDIPRLVQHYIGVLNQRAGRRVEGFTEEAMEQLLRYDWPGNIRELKNVVEAIFVNLPPRHIALLDLPDSFRQRLRLTDDLPTDERARLVSALFATNWNKSRAAQKLHWSRMTLYRKLAKYRLVQSRESNEDGKQPSG